MLKRLNLPLLLRVINDSHSDLKGKVHILCLCPIMTLATAPYCLIHSIVQQLNKTLPLPVLTPPCRARSLTRTHREYVLAKCQAQVHCVYVTNFMLLQQKITLLYEFAFLGIQNWAMLPNWGSNLHYTSCGKPLLYFPTSRPFSSPVNALDANYVIHLRGQQPTADNPPHSPRRRQQSGVRNGRGT